MSKQVFEGLEPLFQSAFPKKCRNCGRVYETAEQFFNETLDMPRGRSSLRSAVEDDGETIVEAFRNCRCGSTLMDSYNCRRDRSEQGRQRRAAHDSQYEELNRPKTENGL